MFRHNFILFWTSWLLPTCTWMFSTSVTSQEIRFPYFLRHHVVFLADNLNFSQLVMPLYQQRRSWAVSGDRVLFLRPCHHVSIPKAFLTLPLEAGNGTEGTPDLTMVLCEAWSLRASPWLFSTLFGLASRSEDARPQSIPSWPFYHK